MFDEAERRVVTNNAVLGTFVDPEDAAAMAVCLASEKGRHISTHDVNVDG